VNDLQDIEVAMTFVRTEDGGRKNPVFSGYRPQFYYDGKNWGCRALGQFLDCRLNAVGEALWSNWLVHAAKIT
jgi:hypothetical protein